MNHNLEASRIPHLLLTWLVLTLGLGFAGSTRAQESTNLWPGWVMTRLESLQTNANRVIVKAASPIGSVAAHGATIAVLATEVTDTASGQTASGLTLTVFEGEQTGGVALVDYEELSSLLSALDYLSRVDWSVTSLSSFDAFSSTKDGFRVAAFSSKRTGTIEYAARTLRSNQRPALLTRDQLMQLRSLIDQAKGKLDSIRTSR